MPEALQVRVLEAIRLRLEAIDRDYFVDYGPSYPEADDCPAILIVDGGDENPNPQQRPGRGAPMFLTQTVEIHCFAKIDRSEHYSALLASRLRSQVKNAILDESVQRLTDDAGELGGVHYVSTVRIETDGGVVGYVVTFTVQLEEYPGNA